MDGPDPEFRTRRAGSLSADILVPTSRLSVVIQDFIIAQRRILKCPFHARCCYVCVSRDEAQWPPAEPPQTSSTVWGSGFGL